MKAGGSLCHGCFHCEQGLILLILHLYLARCPGGRYLILCYDSGNIIPVHPYPGVQKLPVSNILMGCFHGPRMARGRELDIRHIKACDDLHHPRNCKRFLQVKAFYHAVGNGAVHHLGHQKPLRL